MFLTAKANPVLFPSSWLTNTLKDYEVEEVDLSDLSSFASKGALEEEGREQPESETRIAD